MKLNVSQGAHFLLKHVLTTTGEKELAPNGQEVQSPRRLNGEESAQRRFYFKAIDPLIAVKKAETQKMIDEAKEAFKKGTPKGKKETEKEYEAKMIALLNTNKELIGEVDALNKEKMEVELTDKTMEVIKKYFKEYRDKNGWTAGDDDIASELEGIL